MTPTRTILAATATLLLAACGAFSGTEEFAKSAAGNSILTAEDFCSMRKETRNGAMVLMLPKDSDDAWLSFEADAIAIADGQETADFGLIVTSLSGQFSTIPQDRVQINEQLDLRIFAFPVDAAALTAIRGSQSLMFMWGEDAATIARQPLGYADDFAQLARCLGPAASRYPVLRRTAPAAAAQSPAQSPAAG